MNTHTKDAHQSPDELEREIDETRSEIDYTLDALAKRLSPGEVLNQAMDYWRQGPKTYAREMGGNLSRSVRDNPLALGLVGAGLAWLMMGRPAHQQSEWDEQVDWDEHAEYYAGTDTPRVYVPGQQEDPAHASSGDSKWRSAKEKAAAGADSVSAKAGDLRDAAARKAQRARQGMSATAGQMRSRARRYRAETGQQIRRAGAGVSELFREQPLVVGALGLAAGALIAASLPTTRREDEFMGDTRDHLLDRARSAASEGVEAAKRAGSAAAAAARDEAERQGLTPEQGESAVRDAAEKLGNVAKAAGDAAQSEVKRSNGAADDHSSPFPHH